MTIVGAQFKLCRCNRREIFCGDDIVEGSQPASITEGGGHKVIEPEHIQPAITRRKIGGQFLNIVSKNLRQLEIIYLDVILLRETVEELCEILRWCDVG